MQNIDTRFYSRLTKEQMGKVKRSSKKDKISLAEVVRKLIDKYL